MILRIKVVSEELYGCLRAGLGENVGLCVVNPGTGEVNGTNVSETLYITESEANRVIMNVIKGEVK